jgi:hypothetical protein
VSTGHFISCHHAEDFSLKGALEHQTAMGLKDVENKQQIDDIHKRRNKMITNQNKH